MNLLKMFTVSKSKSAFVFALCVVVVGCVKGGGTKKSTKAPPTVFSYTSPEGPKEFRVKFETTKGNFVVEAKRKWSPVGVDRFHDLVSNHFYDDCRFFRVLGGSVVQFGINGDIKTQKTWVTRRCPDDQVIMTNRRGWMSFAHSGQLETRTTQVFINLTQHPEWDDQGFSPFAKVIEGMDVVDKLYSGYGEQAPKGSGPMSPRMNLEGNDYLKKDFPKLDFIIKASFVVESTGKKSPGKK